MIVETLAPGEEGALPGPLLTELAGLYASRSEVRQLSGDFGNPDRVRPEEVAVSLADDLARPGSEVLLARSAGRLVGIAVTLAHPPPPGDACDDGGTGGRGSRSDDGRRPDAGNAGAGTGPASDAWIGLLMVHSRERRSGHGRELATRVEDRFLAAGRTGIGLAVHESNTAALAFWASLGYRETGRHPDRSRGGSCHVLRKPLGGAEPAGPATG